jgi:hypothetical protein
MLATSNNGPVFLAVVAQIAMVILKIPQLSSGRRKVIVEQAVVWRLGTQWVGGCACDEAAEVNLDLFAITGSRVRPIQVVNVESISEPEETVDVT